MTSQELDTLISRLNALYQDYARLQEERLAIELEYGGFLDAAREKLRTHEAGEAPASDFCSN